MTDSNVSDESGEGKDVDVYAILRGIAVHTQDELTAMREEGLERDKATFEAASSAGEKVLELGRYLENLRDTVSAYEASAMIAWELSRLSSYVVMIQDEVRDYREHPLYRTFMKDYRQLFNDISWDWSNSRSTDAKSRDQLVEDAKIRVGNFLKDTVTGLSEKLNA